MYCLPLDKTPCIYYFPILFYTVVILILALVFANRFQYIGNMIFYGSTSLNHAGFN